MGLLDTITKIGTSFSPFSSLISGGITGLASAYGAKQQRGADVAASQKQMDFQQRMSNTSYQRAMKDMRKAGLNPMLAYAQGGASTPGGASPPSAPNIAGGAATAALNSAQSIATIQNTKANTEQTEADNWWKKQAIGIAKDLGLDTALSSSAKSVANYPTDVKVTDLMKNQSSAKKSTKFDINNLSPVGDVIMNIRNKLFGEFKP